MNTFRFECKKLRKKKTTWLAFFITLIGIIGFYLFHLSVAEKIHQKNIAWLDYLSQMFASNAETAALDKKKAEEAGDTEKAEEFHNMMVSFQKSSENAKQDKEYFANEEWTYLIEEDIRSLEPLIEDSAFSAHYIEDQPISMFTVRATLEEKQRLQKYDIVPFIQNTTYTNYLPTIYDDFSGSTLEEWEKITERYGRFGFYFLYQLIQSYFLPIIVLIGVFLFGNGISSESGKKKKGLHFYATLPFSKGRLFFAKYASGLLYTLGFTFMMLLTPIVTSLFFKGVGSLKYPVLVYDGSEPSPYGSHYNALDPKNDTFHFIELQDYFLKVLFFSIILVIFLYSCYFLLSLFIKNPGINIILLGSMTFVGMKFFPKVYNPFTYVDIHKIITREIATIQFNPAIEYQTGMILLFVVSLIITFISYRFFAHRNRLFQ
ncbi:ABC transporter permease [Fervidibacillus halotolerans]|uniref:ABC transporter permease n=1 Tax=Fervidibacillus halotolerans TaxID=2980027 RepID=A0A9E8M0S1_9BACI|nr:ABC transporter permease [Fervidibacillus halotolerans]WAA12800.1 ABC transporter permease [Fervidibacillus halotolerans]